MSDKVVAAMLKSFAFAVVTGIYLCATLQLIQFVGYESHTWLKIVGCAAIGWCVYFVAYSGGMAMRALAELQAILSGRSQ